MCVGVLIVGKVMESKLGACFPSQNWMTAGLLVSFLTCLSGEGRGSSYKFFKFEN